MLAAYTTLDLKAQLLNATDRDVEPALDDPSLGRRAWVGLRYQGH